MLPSMLPLIPARRPRRFIKGDIQTADLLQVGAARCCALRLPCKRPSAPAAARFLGDLVLLPFSPPMPPAEGLVHPPVPPYLYGNRLFSHSHSIHPQYILETEQVDTVLHFAAQTHVDNSFGNSLAFTINNTCARVALLLPAASMEVGLLRVGGWAAALCAQRLWHLGWPSLHHQRHVRLQESLPKCTSLCF